MHDYDEDDDDDDDALASSELENGLNVPLGVMKWCFYMAGSFGSCRCCGETTIMMMMMMP